LQVSGGWSSPGRGLEPDHAGQDALAVSSNAQRRVAGPARSTPSGKEVQVAVTVPGPAPACLARSSL